MTLTLTTIGQHVDDHSLNNNFVYNSYDLKDGTNIKHNVFLSAMFTEAFAACHAHLGEILLLKTCKAGCYITKVICK